MFPNFIEAKFNITDTSGHVLRLRLIRHTITLAKSKADADEERKEREAEAIERAKYRPPNSRRSGVHDTNQEMAIESDEDIEDPGITATVKRYLKYDNPFLYSTNVHRYVIQAICTGQVCGLLPSVSRADHILAATNLTPTQMRSIIQNRVDIRLPTHFHLPNVVSIQAQSQLQESIKQQVTFKRRLVNPSNSCANWNAPSRVNPTDNSPDTYFIRDANQTWLSKVLKVVADVESEFQLDCLQSSCYRFMVHRLILSLNRLPDSVENLAISKDKFLYMGGAGGTGKSRVIKATIKCFRSLECEVRLHVTATTGVAADQINGGTIDSLCQLPRKSDEPDFEVEEEEATESIFDMSIDRWTYCQFLILDEVYFAIYLTDMLLTSYVGFNAGRWEACANLEEVMSHQEVN